MSDTPSIVCMTNGRAHVRVIWRDVEKWLALGYRIEGYEFDD